MIKKYYIIFLCLSIMMLGLNQYQIYMNTSSLNRISFYVSLYISSHGDINDETYDYLHKFDSSIYIEYDKEQNFSIGNEIQYSLVKSYRNITGREKKIEVKNYIIIGAFDAE